jgi:hypothetical protein
MNTSPGAPSFVVERSDSFHPEIDLAELGHVLAAEPVPDRTRGRIVGPHDLHVLHTLRTRHRVRGPGAIAADYFVWGAHEAPHRAMTKLGGLPYLPASMRWPERHGTTGDFYAQLNFADSKDIVPSLPGDVLLVFRFHDLEQCTSWDEELYEFLWVEQREQDLIQAHEVRCSQAAANDPWPVMTGYRVRTFDDPDQVNRLIADDSIDARLHSAHATKIGGAATDVQDVRGPEVPDSYRFLGQITGVWPGSGTPYPVVDRAAPVAQHSHDDYEALVSGPGDGVTCLYLDSDARVRMHFSGG